MHSRFKRLESFYLRKSLALAWPMALNALLMQSMLIIDILLVSPLGEIPLAAMGIATTIIAFFVGIQFAIGNGTQLIVGRVFGAKDTQGLVQAFCNGLLINVSAAVLFVAGLAIFQESLVALLTADKELAAQILEYLCVAQYILLVNAVTQVIIVFLNGQGNTKTPFNIYLIELPFNALVSYVLIFGVADFSWTKEAVWAFEGLGLIGAALGSLAAILLRLALLLKHASHLAVLKNLAFSQHIQVKTIKNHFNEILPIATNFIVLSLGNTLYQLLFSQLNIYSYVAITLIFPWLKIATLLIVAWAQSNAISLTQAIGQGRRSHIQPIIKSCLKLGAFMSCCVALALYILSLTLHLVYPNVAPETLTALTIIMPLYVALPLVRTFNTIAGNSLRALGSSVQVLKIHFISQWCIVLPVCAWFILYLELPLFWVFALLPFEELIKALPFYIMLKTNVKNKKAY